MVSGLAQVVQLPPSMRHSKVEPVSVDVNEKLGGGDRYVFDMVKDLHKPVFLILNKIDLIKKPKLLPIMEEFSRQGTFAEIIPVSAETGLNLDRLEREGGVCLVYSHMGAGSFNRDGGPDPRFESRLKDLASRNGWFAPASEILDYLRAQPGWRADLSFRETVRLEILFLWNATLRGILPAPPHHTH